MLALGIIFIITGVGGFFYTGSQLNSLKENLHGVGTYLGVTGNSTMTYLHWGSIIIGILGAIFLILGIIKMVRD